MSIQRSEFWRYVQTIENALLGKKKKKKKKKSSIPMVESGTRFSREGNIVHGLSHQGDQRYIGMIMTIYVLYSLYTS